MDNVAHVETKIPRSKQGYAPLPPITILLRVSNIVEAWQNFATGQREQPMAGAIIEHGARYAYSAWGVGIDQSAIPGYDVWSPRLYTVFEFREGKSEPVVSLASPIF